MDIEYLPAVDGSSMTARFDPPKTNIVPRTRKLIEITELITFPVEMGLDPIEIEVPPAFGSMDDDFLRRYRTILLASSDRNLWVHECPHNIHR